MATFRVYLAYPTTKPPMWNFAKTVVAANSDIALGIAYADWVSERPTPPPPPLSQCRKMVNPVGTTTNLLRLTTTASSVTPAQQTFINEMQDKVGKFLTSKLDGAFSMVSYPAGFNYGITYGNSAYYNQATLQDIDTLLGVSSSGELDLTGAGFSNLYYQILQNVAFVFSQQDQKTMNDEDTAASAQVASVLMEFTNAGGVYSNPLPLGGKLQDVFNQLTKAYGSVIDLPDTLNALRNAIANFKAAAANSYVLHNRYYAATARLQAALTNTKTPGATNGGMQVSDAGYYVGYTPNKLPTANQLIGGLNTTSNAVSIQIAISSFSSSSSNLSIAGKAGFSFPIAEVLDISVNSSASYDLSRYSSSSSALTMDIKYPGITLFASTPSVLSTDNSVGWYALDILQEVVDKTGHDVTGYQLQGSEIDVSKMFGPGMAFSRLKTFVISQQPTVKMKFTGVDTSKVTSDFQQSNTVQLDLLGLFTIGSASSNYSVQNVDVDSSSGTVTVTLGPPVVSGTIPIQQQIAYVLGGVASYPPNNV